MPLKLKGKVLKTLTSLAVSGVFLGLAFHKMSFTMFWTALGQVSLSPLTFSIFFFGLSCLFRALMRRVTTGPLGRVGFIKLFGGVMVGYLANNFLPLRAGEVVRAGYLAAAGQIPAAASLSTIFIERAFDIFSLSFLLFLALSFNVKGLVQSTIEAGWFFLGALTLFLVLFVGIVKKIKRVKLPKVLS